MVTSESIKKECLKKVNSLDKQTIVRYLSRKKFDQFECYYCFIHNCINHNCYFADFFIRSIDKNYSKVSRNTDTNFNCSKISKIAAKIIFNFLTDKTKMNVE